MLLLCMILFLCSRQYTRLSALLLGNIICALHYQRMFFPCTFPFVEIALCLLHNRKISLTPKYEHNKNFYQRCLWIAKLKATPNKRYVRLCSVKPQTFAGIIWLRGNRFTDFPFLGFFLSKLWLKRFANGLSSTQVTCGLKYGKVRTERGQSQLMPVIAIDTGRGGEKV